MNILLLEGNLKENIRINRILNETFSNPGRVHLYSCLNHTEANKLLKHVKMDVFIINTDLLGYSGIDFVRSLRSREDYAMVWVVYISDNLASIREALETNFIDFIVIPVNLDRLTVTMQKLEKYAPIRKQDPSLLMKYKGEYYNFEQDEIYYIETLDKHLYVHLKNLTVQLGRVPVSSIRKELNEQKFRPSNRSILFNVQKMKDIQFKNGGWELSFKGIDDTVYMSEYYKKQFENG